MLRGSKTLPTFLNVCVCLHMNYAKCIPVHLFTVFQKHLLFNLNTINQTANTLFKSFSRNLSPPQEAIWPQFSLRLVNLVAPSLYISHVISRAIFEAGWNNYHVISKGPSAADESYSSLVWENKQWLVCQIQLVITPISFNNGPICLLLLSFTHWLFLHMKKHRPVYALFTLGHHCSWGELGKPQKRIVENNTFPLSYTVWARPVQHSLVRYNQNKKVNKSLWALLWAFYYCSSRKIVSSLFLAFWTLNSESCTRAFLHFRDSAQSKSCTLVTLKKRMLAIYVCTVAMPQC